MPLPLRKTTAPPSPNRCPLSECMRFLAGAWAPNVLWCLSGEPRRFGELRHDLPRISAKVLSTRLRELVQRDLVRRRVIDSSPPSVEYSLTGLGRKLIPALQAIAEVGAQLKRRAPDGRPQ